MGGQSSKIGWQYFLNEEWKTEIVKASWGEEDLRKNLNEFVYENWMREEDF